MSPEERLRLKYKYMLERLEQIDWIGLKAYGSAEEIPDMIRALAPPDIGASDYMTRRKVALAMFASKDIETRLGFGHSILLTDEEAAREYVYSNCCNIFHQGDVYEATPVTVPFLIELLEHDETNRRDRILDLLQCIADSSRDASRFHTEIKTGARSIEGFVQLPPEYVSASYPAVEMGLELYCRLLTNDSTKVRISSALLLSVLVGRRAEIAKAFGNVIDIEQDDHCLAAFLLSLGTLLDRCGEDDPISQAATRQFQKVLDKRTGSAASIAAAIGLLKLQKSETIPDTLDRVWPFIGAEQEFFQQLPWEGQNSPFDMIDDVLKFAPAASRVDWILKGLMHTDPDVQLSAIYCCSDMHCDDDGAAALIVPNLVRLADSTNDTVRCGAIRSLRGLGTAGEDSLKELCKHPAKAVRNEAKTILRHMASDKRALEFGGENIVATFLSRILKRLKFLWSA